ncbi:MAG: MarR family transcriptional regulator [Bauldia sp.]
MSRADDAREAAFLIDRLERLTRGRESGGGLNPAQWEALRFLSHANRFSRTPAALADYLGSTRGTISQTLIALEEKGYIARAASPRDRRSVDLRLTEQGAAALAEDPLTALAVDLSTSAGTEIGRLRAILGEALARTVERSGGRAFGVCTSCRHFRPGEGPSEEAPHRCALVGEPLSAYDAEAICAIQEPAEAA